MADDGEPVSEQKLGVAVQRPSHAPHVAEERARRAWRAIESSIPPTEGSRPSSGAGRVALIGVVVAFAAAVLLMLGFRADSQLSYELHGASAQDGVIEARRGEATVALSDGSSILAENGSKFSVDVMGRNAALARLVSGKLHVRVIHHDDTSYRFIAGPYEVRVVGTEFELAWDPDGKGLTLSMSKGEVHLASPDGKLVTLKAGQALHLASTTTTLD